METTARKVNTEEKLDIVSFVYDTGKGLRRHIVLILVLMSLAASICYGLAMRSYVPRYSSTATVIVSLKSAVNTNESFTSYYTRSATQQVSQTFPYIASSGVLKNMIVSDFGADASDVKITAAAMEDLNMINIRVTADEPELAFNVLQAVLDNYSTIAAPVIGETDLTVVTAPQIPSHADNPSQPLQNAGKGVLVVLAAAILILLVSSYFKKTVRTEEDFARCFSLKSLGALPRVQARSETKGGPRLVRVDGKIGYGYREAARTLRSRLERDHAETGAKVYMVSSALAGEGKSTVSSNLAISLAEKGYSVILMDMDLRNSSILEVMGLPQEEKGLADLLDGEASIKEILVTDEKSGITILPGGNAGKRSIQMLSSDRPAKLIELARDEADYIIVDTPPSGILSDAATIVKSVDAGIFVVRQDYAPVDRIMEGIQFLSDAGLRLVGCILNYADTGVVGGYGRYSRYGYGRYGYGYGRYGYGYGRYSKYGYGYGKHRSVQSSDSPNKKTNEDKRKPFSSEDNKMDE